MSSWRPMLVTNSPLAFKFISLLSKARKNSLPPRFFLYHYFRKRGKTRNFSPLHLIKTEFLVYLISLILGCTCTRKVHAAVLAAQCNAGSRCRSRARAGPVTLAHKASRWTQRSCFAQSLLPPCGIRVSDAKHTWPRQAPHPGLGAAAYSK